MAGQPIDYALVDPGVGGEFRSTLIWGFSVTPKSGETS